MGADKPNVLFVCVHSAGRSQMAAGVFISSWARTFHAEVANMIDALERGVIARPRWSLRKPG